MNGIDLSLELMPIARRLRKPTHGCNSLQKMCIRLTPRLSCKACNNRERAARAPKQPCQLQPTLDSWTGMPGPARAYQHTQAEGCDQQADPERGAVHDPHR